MEIPGVSSENVSLLDSTQFFSGVSCPRCPRNSWIPSTHGTTHGCRSRFDRVKHLLPSQLGDEKLLGLNRRWRFYRYFSGNLRLGSTAGVLGCWVATGTPAIGNGGLKSHGTAGKQLEKHMKPWGCSETAPVALFSYNVLSSRGKLCLRPLPQQKHMGIQMPFGG